MNEREEIYSIVDATADGMISMQIFLKSNDERIQAFVWDPGDCQAVEEALAIARQRAVARRAWIAGQQEDNYIAWLEEQLKHWKGDSDRE